MKILLAISFCLVFICCKSATSKNEEVQSKIESFLKAHGQAGDGYKFIAITSIDTVTGKEFLDRQLEVVALALTNKTGRLRRLDSLEAVIKKSLIQNPDDETLQSNLKDITRSKTEMYVAQHKLDSLTAMMTPELSKQFKFIGMNFDFKVNDFNGKPVLHHYYIKLDDHLNVIDVVNLAN
ncbi:MAG: hypothetical protein ABJC12_00050 [Saprospiraceae bacterium]